MPCMKFKISAHLMTLTTKYNGSEEYTIHRNQLSIYMYEFHHAILLI